MLGHDHKTVVRRAGRFGGRVPNPERERGSRASRRSPSAVEGEAEGNLVLE